MRTSRAGRAVLVSALLTAACGTVPASPAVGSAAPATTRSSPTPSPSSPTPSLSSPTPRSSTLHVVGLGDSVTSGEHCDCDDYVTGFGHLLAQHAGARVDIANDGESGSTSESLADELTGRSSDDRHLQSDVADADVVVLTMGANDLGPALSAWRSGGCAASCFDPEVDRMQSDLGRVLDRVRTLTGGHTRVLVTTYWNVFTDGQVASQAERSGYLAWSDTVTRRADAAITRVADAHAATLVDLYTPFKNDGTADPTHLLTADGDHPDVAGTALISRTVLAAYEDRP